MSESVLESSCVYCEEPDDMEMVQCDECDGWAHYSCANVGPDIEFLPWVCYWCKIKNGSYFVRVVACNVNEVVFCISY